MSVRLPTNVPIVNLKRQPLNMPIGMLNPPRVSPRTIMAQFDWVADYKAGAGKPNVNVLVSLQGGGSAQQAIDQIRSVKIDNLGNPYPVYVYFIDTTDTIVAPPNSIVWEPVISNSQVANVFLSGAEIQSIIGVTRVYFCNVIVPPYVDFEVEQTQALVRTSARIPRGSNILNPNFGPAAACDQSTFVDINAPVAGDNFKPINWNGAVTGYAYIGVLQLIWAENSAVIGHDLVGVTIQTALGADTVWRWSFLTGAAENGKEFPIPSGMNLKLDISVAWEVSLLCTIDHPVATANLTIGFTTNPT